VTSFAKQHPGFPVPPTIAAGALVPVRANVLVERDGDVGVVRVFRPEVEERAVGPDHRRAGRRHRRAGRRRERQGRRAHQHDGAWPAPTSTSWRRCPPSRPAARCLTTHPIFERIAGWASRWSPPSTGPVLGGGAELSMACHARVVGKHLTLGQPEVNLGIIPGYGGTQRLPRLIGVERAARLIRTGASIGAAEACAWGWAHGTPVDDPLAAAKALIAAHVAGTIKLAPVNPEPIPVPAKLPAVDLGHRSLAIDAIVCDVMRRGLALPLAEGLALEADGFGRCKATVDMDIGMKNFTQNGPRVPAAFLHE
jgi:enoyl-CoA hydratase/3-hydroxyacyl-CoA dehydrogenase